VPTWQEQWTQRPLSWSLKVSWLRYWCPWYSQPGREDREPGGEPRAIQRHPPPPHEEHPGLSSSRICQSPPHIPQKCRPTVPTLCTSPSNPSPYLPSQTGQHCPGILPGYLQGTGGQGRGSHWTLPFCQQGLVSRQQVGPEARPSLPGSHTHSTSAVQAGVPRAHRLPAAVLSSI
jgi:hypothetical protein